MRTEYDIISHIFMQHWGNAIRGMTHHFEVAVIGAGPAGVAAACKAAEQAATHWFRRTDHCL